MEERSTQELENALSRADEIEDVLDFDENTLSDVTVAEYLNQLLQEHNLKKNDIINASCIDQAYAYHIFSGDKKQPGRAKLLALSIAMKLSRVQTEHLLYYGRVNKLYAKNNWDKVIIYALNKKLSVERTNCILSDLSLTPLLG